jgi:hypothetical protein
MATQPGLLDPEIDLPRDLRRRPGDVGPLYPYQRMVANPFLAVFAMLAWYGAVTWSCRVGRLDCFLASTFSALLIPFLFQYHCLDCGATGHVVRAAGHACPRVTGRRQAGARRRFRGPTPVTQTKIWILGMILAGLLGLILAQSG